MSEHEKMNGTGITRLKRALHCSYLGLTAAFRNEEAFRQEVFACLFLVPMACWVGDTSLERALLISSLLILLIVEILNSAIEAVVNRIGLERHPLSGLAKDLGSAAVFLAIIHVVVIWLLVLCN